VQPPATFRLNELLVERGDTDALRACADAGNWQAREPLVKLLVERGDIDALPPTPMLVSLGPFTGWSTC
jgi:hypothetical protein